MNEPQIVNLSNNNRLVRLLFDISKLIDITDIEIISDLIDKYSPRLDLALVDRLDFSELTAKRIGNHAVGVRNAKQVAREYISAKYNIDEDWDELYSDIDYEKYYDLNKSIIRLEYDLQAYRGTYYHSINPLLRKELMIAFDFNLTGLFINAYEKSAEDYLNLI